MAQTNYTPISLYYSATASNVPTAANLVPGELAINTADGKLYYEDSAGVVQVLATKSTGSIGGSNTQVQFNNSGSLGGSSSFTWDGTTVTATKFAGALNGTVGATTASTGAFTSVTATSITNSGLTSGRVTYAGASGLLTNSSNLTFDGTNLTVVGQITANNTIFSNGGFSGQGAYVQRNSTGGATLGSLLSSGSVTFETNLTTAMTILSSGNVGIGLTSPSYQLHVSNNQNAVTQIGLTNNTGGANSQMNFNTTDGTNYGQFGMWGSGVTSSGAQLASSAYVYGSSNVTYFTGGVHRFCISTNTQAMTLDSSGNLLVGTTTSTAGGSTVRTHISGTDYALGLSVLASGGQQNIRFVNGTTAVGSVTTTSSATSYNTSSDQRLKTNVVDAPSGNIDNIKVRSFDWIVNGNHQEYGMIAQELVSVAPYAVYQPKDSNEMMGVDYSKLVPMMIKEIQDLKQRIATLENK
jgi:hypothetical protein